MKKILLVDLCILGKEGGGHAELYFMTILSHLIQEYDLVYACCGNNDLLKSNINKYNINKCEIIDVKSTKIDIILWKLLLLIDSLIKILHIKTILKFNSLINLLIVRRIINNINEEIPVFFHHTDSIMPVVPSSISRFLFPKQWLGLTIAPSYQLEIMEGYEKSRQRFIAEKNFALPSCKGVFVLHPLYQRFFSLRFQQLKCIYLPELVKVNIDQNEPINQDLIEHILQVSQGKKILTMLGNMTPKKDIKLFLESVSKLNLAEKYFVVVLGKLKFPNNSMQTQESYKSSILELIKITQKTLKNNSYIDINYYITSESEFSKLISISDLVFLHYKDFPCSSNILTKAMAHGKPVIVDKGFIMEKIVKKFNWKASVEANPETIANKIEELVNLSEPIEQENISFFLKEHSLEKVRQVIREGISNFN